VAPQWWYVGLALQVYVVFPLIALLLKRFGIAWVLVGAAAVNALSIAAIELLPPAWGYLEMGFVGARLVEVVAGVFLFTVLSMPGGRAWGRHERLLMWALIVGSFATLAFVQPGEWVHWMFQISVVATVGLVLWVPLPKSLAWMRSGPMRGAAEWIGTVSYPLYLCHYAVIALVLASLEWAGLLTTPLLLFAGVPLSLLAAACFSRILPLFWPGGVRVASRVWGG
jgi:peptidoglycan/LPS O-acetylase OafA/YrhL